MTRKEFEDIVLNTYGVSADHPFESSPEVAVFRHASNKKWFAIIMTIPKSKLGINEDGYVDIVNLKCSQEIIDSFWQETGIFPAYHMNKAHWLSVCLDGAASDETVDFLLDVSFKATLPKISKKRK